MLTPEQIKAIREKNGLGSGGAGQVSVLSQRKSELDSAWGDSSAEDGSGGGILEKVAGFSEKVMNPVNNVAVGALKGAASTIATVPQKIGQVVEAAQAPELQKGSESLSNIDVGQLHKQMLALPQGPEKDRLKQRIHDLIDAGSGVDAAQKEIKDTAAAFAEKPDIVKPEGTAQKIGFGAEKAAEFMYTGSKIVGPGEAVLGNATKLVEGASKTAKAGAAAARVVGGAGLESLNAALTSIAQGGNSEQVKQSAKIAFVFGVPFRVLNEAKGPVIDFMKQSAEKGASQALGATTKVNKQLSDKVVPELLKRRVVFATRGGLESNAQANADEAGVAIGKLWDALPDDTKLPIAPAIKVLEDLKDAAIVIEKGQRTVVDVTKFEAAQSLQKKILKIATDPATGTASSEISAKSIRSLRQILDGITERTEKSFGRSGAETAAQEATKDAADAIRNVINEQIPNAGKLNAEFNFWMDVKRVVGSTVERTKSQTGFLTTLGEMAGAVGGVAHGGTAGKAVAIGAGIGLTFKIIKSPAFRMASAVTKNEMAKLIAEGSWEEIAKLGTRIGASIPSSQEQEKPVQE